jgi:hypothetical protein
MGDVVEESIRPVTPSEPGSSPALSRLTELDPRQVWAHEAHDFTPWLLANADALETALGIEVELSSSEYAVGGFAVDLIGRDLTNDCVLIVENQLGNTDHGHLGQLVTYAAGTEARTVVWMATSLREEHRQALDFLNDIGGGGVRFFGVEIAVVRIDSSPPAPLFSLRAQPNDWHAVTSAAARSSSQEAGRGPLYRRFWTKFLDRLSAEHPDWSRARKPPTANWFSIPWPYKGGPFYSFVFTLEHRIRVELYIDYGDPDRNEELFNALSSRRDEIERTFGSELSWEALPERRACRIATYGVGDVTEEDEFDSYIDWFFEAGVRLRNAIEGVAAQVQGGSA